MIAEVGHGIARVLFVAAVDVDVAFEDDEHVGAALATHIDRHAGGFRDLGRVGADGFDHRVGEARESHFGPEGREVELSRRVGECGRHRSIVRLEGLD